MFIVCISHYIKLLEGRAICYCQGLAQSQRTAQSQSPWTQFPDRALNLSSPLYSHVDATAQVSTSLTQTPVASVLPSAFNPLSPLPLPQSLFQPKLNGSL